MKVLFTAKNGNLDSEIDPPVGRCSYFLIVDLDTMNFKSISNESAMASGGAGIQAAQTVARIGVKVVVTGNMGPNAFRTLSTAEIDVFTGANGTIKDAIEKYKKGELKNIETPNVDSHFGIK